MTIGKHLQITLFWVIYFRNLSMIKNESCPDSSTKDALFSAFHKSPILKINVKYWNEEQTFVSCCLENFQKLRGYFKKVKKNYTFPHGVINRCIYFNKSLVERVPQEIFEKWVHQIEECLIYFKAYFLRLHHSDNEIKLLRSTYGPLNPESEENEYLSVYDTID